MEGSSIGRRRRGGLLVTAILVLAVGLGGCGAVGDQAREVTDDVRSRASSELDRAVQDQVDRALERFGGDVDVDRICQLIADDRLTGAERGRLEVAVEVGEALGLPPDVTAAAQQVLDRSEGATDRVRGLSEACREAGAGDRATAG